MSSSWGQSFPASSPALSLSQQTRSSDQSFPSVYHHERESSGSCQPTAPKILKVSPALLGTTGQQGGVSTQHYMLSESEGDDSQDYDDYGDKVRTRKGKREPRASGRASANPTFPAVANQAASSSGPVASAAGWHGQAKRGREDGGGGAIAVVPGLGVDGRGHASAVAPAPVSF